MAFNSNIFLFLFFPLCLFFYYLSNDKLKNFILLLFSVFFYFWFSPETLYAIFINILINYILVISIYKTKGKSKKVLLIISLIFNIGLLGYFKYTNFIVENINNLVNNKISLNTILVPLGISYITFQQISYAVDVYRDKSFPLYNFINYSLYILFFPKLIAGPIAKYSDIANELKVRNHSIEAFSNGIYRFSMGLSKKVILANNLGIVADKIFATSPENLGIKFSWFGMMLYTMQIYFDFSGYSDMAIGIGKMLGFKLPENFNKPYSATSITDFWKRWHISLSSFLKEYIYIPLGGNRCSKGRTYLNLSIVFFISGLWHGANWTFIIWGLYHGVLLMLDRVFALKLLKKIPKFLSNILCLFLVALGWVFFRSDSLSYSLRFIKSMFTLSFANGVNSFTLEITTKTIIIFIWALFLSIIQFDKLNLLLEKYKLSLFVKGFFSLILLIYSIAAISTGSFNPFIYFKF